MNITISETDISEAKELIILLKELGYNFAEKQIIEKIKNYTATKNNKLFLAKINYKICGFLAFNFYDSFIKGPSGKIDTLVIKEEYRHLGIGKKLVVLAQEYAEQLGCKLINVVSSNLRNDAHKFYEKLEYLQDSKYFVKYFN